MDLYGCKEILFSIPLQPSELSTRQGELNRPSQFPIPSLFREPIRYMTNGRENMEKCLGKVFER